MHCTLSATTSTAPRGRTGGSSVTFPRLGGLQGNMGVNKAVDDVADSRMAQRTLHRRPASIFDMSRHGVDQRQQMLPDWWIKPPPYFALPVIAECSKHSRENIGESR